MTRDEAIEAVQHALGDVLFSRKDAERILDAIGWREPIGYALHRAAGTPHTMETAAEAAQTMAEVFGESFTVCALVPVD